MNIEIDQSGKIENTNKDTVIAFSDDTSRSILIKARDKREIQKIFRKIGKSRIFVYKLFSILIFLLIKRQLRKIDQIFIDNEYPGWEYLIKDYLLREIRRIKPDFEPESISFKEVGKKSRAHYMTRNIIHKKRDPDLKVGVKEVFKYIVK